MITDNILSQDIQYGYVFRDKNGKFLDVAVSDAKTHGLDYECWILEDVPVYYQSGEEEIVSALIKHKKLKCKKYKVQISHTVELVGPKKPTVNKNGERLKKA
jgi:hypothetical protein